jgi:hypothetical protein
MIDNLEQVIGFRASKDLARRVDQYAATERVRRSVAVRRLVEEALGQKELRDAA